MMTAKGAGNSEQYELLVAKLREIFQIDKQDLDFGIYRILNARSSEIEDYLATRLKEKVEQSISDSSVVEIAILKDKLKKAEEAAVAAGITADSSPTVEKLRRKIVKSNKAKADHAEQVFSHLLIFFSRYYDNGDFISQRRFKGETYAIPYDGQEVMMYWANQDQYYIKSGQHLSNLTFDAGEQHLVHFEIAQADIAKDNQKETKKIRRFTFIEKSKIVNSLDKDGNLCQIKIDPVSEKSNDLVVRFEYREMDKEIKQDDLNKRAVGTILSQIGDEWRRRLQQLQPTEKNPKRTLLEKQLAFYTQKNTSDYFIHKDLEGFLRRELDFYIKNEVLSLDNLSQASSFTYIEKDFRLIASLQSIANDLIKFLTSIENLQKKLWRKKKFIISSEYCITMNRVPEELHPLIVKNFSQWQQWKGLGLLGKKKRPSLDILNENPCLMVDTSLFDAKFKEKLLSAIDNLDQTIEGLIIQGDNFQTLNLLEERYQNQIDLIYIDPPYNTPNSSEIAYKNNFKHSSWLSLVANTLPSTRGLLKDVYSFGFAIDDHEYNNALFLLRQHFIDCDLSTIVINHHPQGAGGRLSRTHEYYIVASPSNAGIYKGEPVADKTEDRDFKRAGTAPNNHRIGAPGSFYALLLDPVNWKIIDAEKPPHRDDKNYPTDDTEEGFRRIYPLDKKGGERVWRHAYEKGKRFAREGKLLYSKKGSVKIRLEHKGKREVLFSNWYGPKYNSGPHGTNLLDDLGFDKKEFSYPKSIKTMEQSLWMQSFGKQNFTVLDYFAGSGTTAHAAININRRDGGKRRYILVEQGDYLNHVIKPRIQKAVYSAEWKNGLPISTPPLLNSGMHLKSRRLKATKTH